MRRPPQLCKPKRIKEKAGGRKVQMSLRLRRERGGYAADVAALLTA
jgi:hypothetical protein